MEFEGPPKFYKISQPYKQEQIAMPSADMISSCPSNYVKRKVDPKPSPHRVHVELDMQNFRHVESNK